MAAAATPPVRNPAASRERTRHIFARLMLGQSTAAIAAAEGVSLRRVQPCGISRRADRRREMRRGRIGGVARHAAVVAGDQFSVCHRRFVAAPRRRDVDGGQAHRRVIADRRAGRAAFFRRRRRHSPVRGKVARSAG